MPGDKPPGGKREEFKIAEFTGESPTIQLVPGSKKRKALEDKLEQYREREAQEAAQGVKNADTFFFNPVLKICIIDVSSVSAKAIDLPFIY